MATVNRPVRNLLTPDAIGLIGTVHPAGGMAAAAHQPGCLAVADPVQRGNGMTGDCPGGNTVSRVPGMQRALDAQLRGIDRGFLVEFLPRPRVAIGRLVEKKMQRTARLISMRYAWRRESGNREGPALQWWLQQQKNLSPEKR